MRKLFALVLGLGLALVTAFVMAGSSGSQANCQTFPQTGHQVCGKFLTYWQSHGGLAQQGYPISEPFNEKSDLNGQTYQVQYFERAVFEAHPENQPPYDILLSQLGTFRGKEKYPNGFPGAQPAPPPPPPPAAPPGLGVKVPLRAGVTITLVPDIQVNNFRQTGLQDSNVCGQVMAWDFTIDNSSSAPFTVNLDQSTATQTDSTGKKYAPADCASAYESGAFRAPTTVAAGDKAAAQVLFKVPNIPSAVAYLDLQINVTGIPLTFRYSLR